jgi:23S rRNA pseudouridine955/2504/2580 synthase
MVRQRKTRVPRKSAGKTPSKAPGARPRAPERPAAPERRAGPAAPAVRKLVVAADHAGQRLDNYLLRVAKGVPKSHVYRIVRSGEVRVNGGRVRADYRLAGGEELRLPPMRVPAPAARAPTPAELPPVLFEDEHLLALEKPSGLAVHGGSGVSHGLIERARAARPNQEFLELGHRLDRETSGVILLAKSRRCLLRLHEQLRAGEVDKRYLALVSGDWVNDQQHIRLALAKRLTPANERRVHVDPEEGAASHTIVRLRQRFGEFSLLEAELKTGRTHQIRVHLAHLGFPIVGDDKYGDFELNRRVARGEFGGRLSRMFLHAFQVRLAHPVTGEALRLSAPLPAECKAFVAALLTQAKVARG